MELTADLTLQSRLSEFRDSNRKSEMSYGKISGKTFIIFGSPSGERGQTDQDLRENSNK